MVDPRIERLVEAIDALDGLDPAKLSDCDLHSSYLALQKARDRLGGTAGLLGARWDHVRLWAQNQSLTPQQRLSNEAKCDLKSAKREMRRARKLADMPATAAAVRDGRLSLDHLDLLGRANHGKRRKLFARDEQLLVEQCAKLRYPDAVKAVEYWIIRANAEVGEPDPPAPKSEVFLSPVGDRWALDGDLDAISGTIVDGELDRIVKALYLADKKAGVERTNAERRAAALTEMAIRSASAPGSGARRRPLFTALVGDGTLAELCELANGMIIRPAQLAGWLNAALLETVLFDGPQTVMSVSHRRRFTGALRRAIEVRDRHCQHASGCDTPADKCDADHIVPHARGGPTSQFSGRIECPPHNRHADLHDFDAQPLPERRVDFLEQWRCRLRWRMRHEPPDD